MAFVIIFIPSSRLVEFAIIRRVFLISNCAKKKKKDFSVSCVLCRDVEDLLIFSNGGRSCVFFVNLYIIE